MRSRFLVLIGLTAVAAVWATVRTMSLPPSPFGEIPAQLVGRWTTSDARFAGRSMVMTPSTISFGTGQGVSPAHPVISVERDADPEVPVIVYTIRYRAQGEDEQIVMVRDFQGALRLQNRLSTAWHREPSDGEAED